MPTAHPRVQVTVDPQLAAALDELDPAPASRSRQIRDLALRGAKAQQGDETRHREAIDGLLRIARGETTYDPASAREAHAQREADLPEPPPR
ncbi:MAG: hypothetical protein M3481_01000 [Actinomycetota bacterium]|jgi:metal-responsive CopG/Arc/MetJ family transcriptional regulator|nr:hypothetical protein [Actinomycetota bacterium]